MRKVILTTTSPRLSQCGSRRARIWRKRYVGWPALKKLQYVDDLMAEIAGQRPTLTHRLRVDPINKLTDTLAEHYRKKQAHYSVNSKKTYDRALHRIILR